MPLFAKVCAVIVGTMVLGTVIAYSGGAITVCVKEKEGHHIHVPFPALAFPVGAWLIPRHDWQMAHSPELRQATQQWLPVAKIVAQELDRCPDGVLVQVDKPGENVSIRKEGNYLLIDVESRREEVHVSLPLRIVTSVLQEIEVSGPTV